MQPARQVEIGQQQLFLLLGTLELVEEAVQAGLVVARDSQAHALLGAGAVVVDHTLAHAYGSQVEQVAHLVDHVAKAGGACNLVDLHASASLGHVEHHLVAVAQLARALLLVVGVDAHKRLALHLEPAGHGSAIHLAHRAQVVVGNPLPQLELGVPQDGTGVEQ